MTGWYAFERLDSLSEPLRKSYLIALIPCLVNVVTSVTNYFRGKWNMYPLFFLANHTSIYLYTDKSPELSPMHIWFKWLGVGICAAIIILGTDTS